MFYVVFAESLLLPLCRIRLSIQRHNVFEILYIGHHCQDLRNHTAYLHNIVAASSALTVLFQLCSFILRLFVGFFRFAKCDLMYYWTLSSVSSRISLQSIVLYSFIRFLEPFKSTSLADLRRGLLPPLR